MGRNHEKKGSIHHKIPLGPKNVTLVRKWFALSNYRCDLSVQPYHTSCLEHKKYSTRCSYGTCSFAKSDLTKTLASFSNVTTRTNLAADFRVGSASVRNVVWIERHHVAQDVCVRVGIPALPPPLSQHSWTLEEQEDKRKQTTKQELTSLRPRRNLNGPLKFITKAQTLENQHNTTKQHVSWKKRILCLIQPKISKCALARSPSVSVKLNYHKVAIHLNSRVLCNAKCFFIA